MTMVAFCVALATASSGGSDGGGTKSPRRKAITSAGTGAAGKARLNLRDASVLDAELRKFSASLYSNEEAFPRRRDLIAAHRADLRAAIERYHGGFRAFRAVSTQRRAPPRDSVGDSRDSAGAGFSALARSIRDFIEEHVIPLDVAHADIARQYLPPHAAFRLAGRSDLISLIQEHGGSRTVAWRMRLHLHYHAATDYSGDLVGMLDAMRLFMSANNYVRLPTTAQLRDAGRLDLIAGIRVHGGAIPVARALGVKVSRGGGGGMVVAPVEKRGSTMLDENFFILDCADEVALAHNEGRALPGARGGGGGALLPREGGRRRAHHHFRDFEVLRSELAGYIFDDGVPGVMPTAAELIEAGRRDLVRAMQTHGGQKNVAARLGLARRSMGRKQMAGSAIRVRTDDS